jgi:hypothetical protein
MINRSFPFLVGRPVLVIFLVVPLLAHVPLKALGEGLRDFADGWLLNPGDMAFVLATTPPRDTRGWGLWAGAGQGQLFSMEELPLKSVECGIVQKGGPLPLYLACSWERLGDELMVEETSVLRFRLGRNPQAGIRVRARRWIVMGEQLDTSLESGLEGRLSFTLGAGLTGNVAVRLHPGSLPEWHGRGGRRTLAEGKLFYPGGGLAVRLDQRSDGVPILSLELMGRLTSRLGLGVRADPETGSLGGNLVIRVGGLWLNTSHLVHPALGLTHRFHLGVGDPEASVW